MTADDIAFWIMAAGGTVLAGYCVVLLLSMLRQLVARKHPQQICLMQKHQLHLRSGVYEYSADCTFPDSKKIHRLDIRYPHEFEALESGQTYAVILKGSCIISINFNKEAQL